MNRAYKVIWNNARNCYVVVSEIAKNHGKNNTRSIVSRLAARVEGTMMQMASAMRQAFSERRLPVAGPRTAAQWIVPLVLAGILLPANAWATEITTNGAGIVDKSGNVYDVYTQKIVSSHSLGINEFKKFNLDSGHIANMHFKMKNGSEHVDSLVNLVQDRININGTVNAVKNNRIDGNLYFLSGNGMAVGPTGVINAGKFVALAPSSDYFEDLWENESKVAAAFKNDFNKFGTRVSGGEGAGTFNTTGLEFNSDAGKGIKIRGKINTRSGIVLGAGNIAIENGALLKSQKDLNFASLVNTQDAAGAVFTNIGMTAVAEDKSGDIILRSESSHEFINNPLLPGVETYDSIANVHNDASVAVRGEISGDGNVDISAASSTVFNNKEWTGLDGLSSVGAEFLNDLGINMTADWAHKVIAASVTLDGTGKINAGGNAALQADSGLTIKTQAKTVGKKEEGTTSALPVAAVAVVNASNKALVDIRGELSAGGDIALAAKAGTALDSTAKALTVKADNDNGNAIYLGASLLFGNSVAEINVDEAQNNSAAQKLSAGGAFSAKAETDSSIAVEAASAGMNDTFASTAVAWLDYDSAANVNLKRSVEAESVTADATNTVDSLGISADNSNGEGIDSFVEFKVSGDTNAGALANKIKTKLGWGGFRQGGKLQGMENVFSNALEYVTAGAAVAVVDSTNTANVTVAPGVELKALGDAVKKDGKGNTVNDADGNPIPGGDISLNARTDLTSFSHAVTGQLNKQQANAANDSKVGVAVAFLYSNIDNDATVELQSGNNKGVSLNAAKGNINLNADVDSDDNNSMSTLRATSIREAWDNLIKDFKRFGKDASKLTKWKDETVNVQTQLEDGSVSKAEAAAKWTNLLSAFGDFISDEGKDYLKTSNDAKKLVGAVSDMLSPASYTNYYVRSYSIDGQDSHGSNYDIAASVNIATMENKGIVAIGEQSALTTGGDITIHSETATEAVSATGNGGEFLAYSETNGTGIGASFAWQDISADSLVLAGKNVKMQAGSASERARGDIAVSANAAVEDIAIIYSGGKADRSGLAGSFNIQDGGSNSLILVDDEATLEAPGAVSLRAANSMTAANIVGGLALGSAKSKATVGAGFALNRLDVNSMAVIGDNGTGASTESTDTESDGNKDKSDEEKDRLRAQNTLAAARALAADRAKIRSMDRDFEDAETAVQGILGAKTGENGGKGSVTGQDITVSAQNKGTINAVAVEGVSNSENHAGFDTVNKWNKTGAQAKSDITDSLQNVIGWPVNKVNKLFGNSQTKNNWNFRGYDPIPQNNDAADNSFNAALAGSVSVNWNDSTTAAVLDNTELTLRGKEAGTAGKLKNEALDDLFTGAWAGAAALNWFSGGAGVASNNAAHKGALGAAVSVNNLERDVKAQISNANISQARQIENTAIMKGTEAAAALGLAVTKDSQGTGVNLGAAFGLSMNKTDSDVHALMVDDTSMNTDSTGTYVDNRAYDGDIQVAGGVDFAFANAEDGGKAVAAGITAAVSEINNDIRSGISGGSYTGIADLKVAGENALTQVNAAVALGISTAAHGFNGTGSLAYAELNNTNRGYVIGTETLQARGEVSVTDRDISGREGNNAYVSYLKNRKVDATGESYLNDETKEKLGTEAGSAIVNVAVEASGGKTSSAGAAITVGRITNKFSADIAGNKELEASRVKAAADVHTNIVSVAAGVSVSTRNFGGAGSLSFNDLDQDNIVSVTGNRDGSREDSGIKADTVSGTARNTSHIVNVTGDFAGGKNAVGLGLAYNRMDDTTGVYFSRNRLNSRDASAGSLIDMDAQNDAYALALSVGAAASYKDSSTVAAHGNFAVNRGHNDTIAVMGEDKDGKTAKTAADRDSLNNVATLKVNARDKTTKTTIAGDADVSLKGSTVALGVGVALTESDEGTEEGNGKETVRAEIRNTDIKTRSDGFGKSSSVNVTAADTSTATTVAAGVGITKKSAAGAQLVLADAEINKDVSALLKDTTVNKNENVSSSVLPSVTVHADSDSTIKTGAAALQLSGQQSFLAGVAAVGINRLKNTASAGVVYSEKQTARSMNVGNLDIRAASAAGITSAAAGASGTWKGTAALGGSGSYNYIENNAAAKIENGDIYSKGSAGVIAQSDDAVSNYAGVLEVDAGSQGIAAAIGVAGSNNTISGKTEALIQNSNVVAENSNSAKIKTNSKLKTDGGYLIDGAVTSNTWKSSKLQTGREEEEKEGVVVDASATHSIASVLANGGVAVAMGDGGLAGSVAGVVNLNHVDGSTTARVLDSQINNKDKRSGVTVHAADFTNVAEFSGAASVGISQTGAGAAGFTGNTNKVDRVTAAAVSSRDTKWNSRKKQYETNGNSKTKNTVFADTFAVTADAKQAISSFNVAGAVAGATEIALETGDNVSTGKMESATVATVTNATVDFTRDAKVEASHEDAVYNMNIDAGLAIAASGAGIAASLNVGVGVVNEESVVTADVVNSVIKKGGTDTASLAIGAGNKTTLETTLVSAGVAAGLFSGGIAASVAVNNIESRVASRITGSDMVADTLTVQTGNDLTIKDRTGDGVGGLLAGIGVGVDVNTLNDSVSTVIENSTLKAKDRLAVTTGTQRDIDATTAGVAVGGAEIGVNVLVVTVNSGLGDTDDVKDEEKNSGTFSHKGEVNKTLEMVNNNTNYDLSGYLSGLTDDEKKDMQEQTDVNAKNGDGITGAGVHTYVRGNSSLEAVAGDVTVFNDEYNDGNLNGGTGGFGVLAVNVTDTLYHLNQQNDIAVDSSSIIGKGVAMVAQQANKREKDEAISVRTTQASAGVAGVGVGYAGIVTKGSTGVSVNKSTIRTTDGNLTLKSTDTSRSKAHMMGIQPVSSMGVQVSVANNEDRADNYVSVKGGSFLTAERIVKSETVKVTDENGKEQEVTVNLPAILTLQADRGGRTAAKALGVSVGGLEVLVNNAWATDTGKAAINVNGSNNTFTADRLRLEADNAPVLKAEAGGTDVGIIVGVSVMHSNATARSQALVNVEDNNKLLADNVEAKAVIGKKDTVMAQGESHSTGVSVGVNVNANASRAITETTAKVAVGKEVYKTEEKEETVTEGDHEGETVKVTEAVTDLNLVTENNARRRSVLGNFTIGLVSSIGAGDAIAEGKDKSFVEAGGGDVNKLKVLAGGSSETRAFADGDGGGITDFGAHATVTVDTRTTNTATLSGVWNVKDTANIAADQTTVSKATSRTGAGGILSITWANSDNKLAMDTKTVLTEGTVLNADQAYVQAVNRAKVGPDDGETYSNHMNIGGVIQISPDVKSDAAANTKANVEVGDNSKVTTRTGQVYDVHTELDHTNKVEGKGGGVGENIWAYSVNNVTADNGITVGKNASLRQEGGYDDGDLTLSASDDVKLNTVAEAKVGGAGGVASADAENNVTRNNKIQINGDLYSGHDINLFAGKAPEGTDASLTVSTGAAAYNYTLISLYTDPVVTYNLKNNQQVEVGADGRATSVHNINVAAENGTETIFKDVRKINFFANENKDYQILTNDSGKSNIKETNNNYVKVDGALKTGIHNKAIIEISGSILPDGLTPAGGSGDGLVISTEGSNVEISEEDIETGTMDYASQLGNQLQAVEKLLEDYGVGSNAKETAAYYGYVQQRQRILEEMEKRGLYEDVVQDGKTVRVYKAGGITVRYVEVPEILVSGGSILVRSDTLYGSGRLNAGGVPQASVSNYSNAFLKIDGVRVGDNGGEIRFQGVSVAKNEDVNNLNKAKDRSAAFAEFENDTATGRVSTVLVDNENRAGNEIPVKDANGNQGLYRPVANVAVTGNITNDFGDVRIHNASGDISIGSGDSGDVNIIGKMIQLTAPKGSISQDFVDGIVNIGGRPPELNSEEVRKSLEDLRKGSSYDPIMGSGIDLDLKSTGTDITRAEAGRIAGDSVYIAASDINVNGLIQSGFSRYEADIPGNTDFNKVAVPANEVTVQGRTMYKVNDGGRVVYDKTAGAFKYVVQVYYDPQARNLVVEDIDTKGGRIYLTGRISSTGDGRILAMDGGAEIAIHNGGSLDLNVGGILNNDIEGKITITDLARDTWTEYTHDAIRTITDYSKYGKDLAAAEQHAVTTEGIGYAVGAYAVKPGLRYNWSLGTETGETKYYHKVDSTLFWGALDIGSDTDSSLAKYETSTPYEIRNNGTRQLGSGEFIDQISGDYYMPSYSGGGMLKNKKLKDSEFGSVYENKVTSYTRTVTNQWKEGGDWWAVFSNPKYHLEWTTKTGSTQTYTFSLAADKDISIGFLGQETGSIALVNTNRTAGDIVLSGNIKNNTADAMLDIQSAGGSIVQKGGTSLNTGEVHLYAKDNIENIRITTLGTRNAGADGIFTTDDGLRLSAESRNGGNIDITVEGGTEAGQALPGNVIIKKLTSDGLNAAGKPGDVMLTADGNITQQGASATVRGLEVKLESINGGIGTKDQEVVLDTPADAYGMNPDSAAVNAGARTGIYLTEADGDMRVGSIISREGDVTLTAYNGHLLDALPETETTNNMHENDLVRRWIDMGLIAGTEDYEGAYITGLKQDAANYKARVEKQMALCVSGEANDDLKAEYTNPDGSLKYADADAYLAQDENYKAIVDKYEHPKYLWTKDQMLHAIRIAIINKESGVTTETQKKVANVQGKNVTLAAKGVGMLSDEKTEILFSELGGGSDTAIANLKLLANADAEDVTLLDSKENILSFATDSDGKQVVTARDSEGNPVETDGKIHKFVINNLDPLGVKATGQVNITAYGDNAFIAGRSDDKDVFSPVNTGIITAVGQDVRLYTQEGIYNALKGADINYGNIHAENLLAYGGTKDIGASDKYLGVALSGDLLTANADGSIYIKNTLSTEANGVLRVGSLYAGDTIAIDSPLGIVMTRDADYAQAYLNAGKQLQFDVNAQNGMVGSEEAPLRILNSGSVISLTAGSANLKGVQGLTDEDTAMKLGAVTTAGGFAADSEGKLETSDTIKAGREILLSGRTGIALNGEVEAGRLDMLDGMIYTGGAPVTLISNEGSIIQEDGGIRAARVAVTSAHEVSLQNERNTFRNFAVQGLNTWKQDEDNNWIYAVDGSVTVYAHGGSKLTAAFPQTVVYGDVVLGNLDEGSLTITTGIEAKAGKNGEDGSVLIEQQGDILVQGALRADGDVKEWSVNGTASHTGNVRAGKNVDIAAGNGINISGSATPYLTVLTVEAGGNTSLKALDGPMRLDRVEVLGEDVELFGDGDILEAEAARINAAGTARVTQKTGDISLVNTDIEAGTNVYITNKEGKIRSNQLLSGFKAGQDVIVRNETGAIELENTPIDAGIDVVVETVSGNIRMTDGKVNAKQDITVSSQGGDILMTGSAHADRNLTVGTAGSGNVDVSGGVYGVITAGQDVMLAAENGTIRVRDNLNPLTSEKGDVTIETTGGNIEATGRINAGKNIAAKSGTGDITLTGAITAKQDIKGLSLGGDITVTDRARAGRDLVFRTEQDGQLNLESSVTDPNIKKYDITSGRDVVLVADNGSVNINNRIAAPDGKIAIATTGGDVIFGKSVKAGEDISVTSDNGMIRTTSKDKYPLMDAGHDVRLETTGGTIELGDVPGTNAEIKAANDVIATSFGNGSIRLYNTVTAERNIEINNQSGTSLLKGTLNAGQDVIAQSDKTGVFVLDNTVAAERNVTLYSYDGEVTVQGNITAGQDVSIKNWLDDTTVTVDAAIKAGGKVSVTGDNTDIHLYGDVEAGGDVDLNTRSGDIVVGGKAEAGERIYVRTRYGNASVTGDVEANELSANVTYGTLTLDGGISTRKDLAARNENGDIVMKKNVQAGQDLTLAVQRDGKLLIDLPEDDRDISAGRNVTLKTERAPITIENKVTAETGNAHVITSSGNIEVRNTVSAAQDVMLSTDSGNIIAKETGIVPLLDAGGDVKLETKSGNIELGSFGSAKSPVNVGGNLIASSKSGDITEMGVLTVWGNNEAYNGSGDITMILTGGAGGDIIAENQGGEISLTVAAAAAKNITATNTGKGNVKLTGGVGAAQDIAAKSEDGDIMLTGVVTAGKDIVLRSTGGNIIQTGTADAVQDIRAVSDSGNISLMGGSGAGGDIVLENGFGKIEVLGAIGSGGDIKVSTITGDITVAGTNAAPAINAGKDAVLGSQDGSVAVQGSVKASQDVVLEDLNGDISVTGNVTAGMDVSARTEGGDITVAGDVSAADVYARSTTGNITVRKYVTANMDVEVISDESSVTVAGNITAGRNIFAKAGGEGELLVGAGEEGGTQVQSDITAGRNIDLMTADGKMMVHGSVKTEEYDVTMTSKAGDINIKGDVEAGNYVSSVSESGNISIEGNVKAEDSVAAVTDSGNIVFEGDVEAKDSVTAETKSGVVSYEGSIKTQGTVTAEATETGSIFYIGNVEAGKTVTAAANNGMILYAGDVTSESADINATASNGYIGYSGNVKAGGNITGTVQTRGDIAYLGTVKAGGEVQAVTANGQVRYDGDVEAGDNATADVGAGSIWYGGNVRAGSDVTAVLDSGIILYDGSVSAGRNIEATVTGEGSITYIKPVKAGRNVIANVNIGDIWYNDDVTAGRSVISKTGSGSIAYMGKVTAGKDLPEQIRYGYGKIAYFDRYGLVGYSNSFAVAPVRNATANEIEINEGQQ